MCAVGSGEFGGDGDLAGFCHSDDGAAGSADEVADLGCGEQFGGCVVWHSGRMPQCVTMCQVSDGYRVSGLPIC